MHESMGYRAGGAYNGHFCHHGEWWLSYTGPNAATGNTWANLNLHAWCYLATVGTPVTPAAQQAAYELTLFERNRHVGGHTHTVEINEPESALGPARIRPVDTGFMVYNEVTYPLLTRLFRELAVPTKPTDMSFSVKHTVENIEFSGSSLNHLFAQRRNLLRPRFVRMLLQIHRFNQEAVAALNQPDTAALTLGDYVRARNYGDDFFNLYLAPMSSAVWSTPPEL